MYCAIKEMMCIQCKMQMQRQQLIVSHWSLLGGPKVKVALDRPAITISNADLHSEEDQL